jgi:ATP-dependent RNA helicase RhlE
MNFSDFKLNDALTKSLTTQGYVIPTPIQIKAIPIVLEGHDVMAAAKTGTGKTAAFGLPIIERLLAGKASHNKHIRALILAPTRELAAQVGESISLYARHTPLRTHVVFGGVNITNQITRLSKGTDILVATPGRLLDLYQQEAVAFDHLEVLVLDEADRMLDMGFIHDIKRIIKCLPKKRQTLMFSATFSQDIQQLAKGLMDQPKVISLNPDNASVQSVEQRLIPVDKKKKSDLLFNMMVDEKWTKAIIFMRTKHTANRLTHFLQERGVRATAIHGNKSQAARTKALEDFKNGKVDMLIATDIAARGLDIDQLPHVVNFDLPNVPEDYVHRIGRTGRAGALGIAVSLVSADEIDQLVAIERFMKQIIKREYYPGFEPSHELPASNLTPTKHHVKHHHKPKTDHPSVQPGRPPRTTQRKTGPFAPQTK